VFNQYKVSVAEDEKVLEMDSGNGFKATELFVKFYKSYRYFVTTKI